MTDKLHQSLSSIMDAAGDDLELPRLLNAMQSSPELEQQLGDKWRRYHLAQGIMQGDLRGVRQPQVAQMDISAKVMQQLEAEGISQPDSGFSEATASPVATPRQEKAQWFRGGALAASVALLVITGVQVFNATRDGVQPGSSVPLASQQEQPAPQQSAQSSKVTSSSSNFNGPLLQVSSSPSSPFAPQAFTGRSLVNFATGEQPLQSRQEAARDNFSPVESQSAALQPAASQ